MSELDILKRIKTIERQIEKLKIFDVPKASSSGGGGGSYTLENHDHSGDPADGGVFALTNLSSGAATNNQVPKANGAGGIAWLDESGGAVLREAIFTKPGELFVGVGATRYYNLTGAALTISKVHLAVDTPNTGISLIVDANIDGVTIFTVQANRPVIVAGANTGFSVAMNVTNWPNNSYVTMDLDQVGSTFPGANFTGTIVCS